MAINFIREMFIAIFLFSGVVCLQMMNCYDNSSHEMILHPFSYQHQFQQIDLWLSQSDKFLLKVSVELCT